MERQDRWSESLGFTERDFKICDLCGALNPAANDQCFVCGWSGMFDTDRENVRDAMRALENHHGQISESLFLEEVVPSFPPRPGLWAELVGSLRRLMGRA